MVSELYLNYIHVLCSNINFISNLIIICDVVVVALVSSRCVCEVFIPCIQRKVYNSVTFQFRIIICLFEIHKHFAIRLP